MTVLAKVPVQDSKAIDEFRRDDKVKLELQNARLYNEDDLILVEKVIEDVPVYPIGFYPDSINDFCEIVEESLNIPSDFLKNNMLAVFGSVIGTKSVMEIKKGWEEPAIVWTTNVAYASGKKSPALTLTSKPMEALEEAEDEKYKFLMEEYLDKFREYEKTLNEWKAKKRKEKPIEPQMPIQKDFIIKDTTIEAVTELVANNDILNIQDEMAGWLLGMDMYKNGKGNERQKWLTYWSGGSNKVTRRSGRIKTKQRTSINITGTIQPDRLSECLKQNNDGLVERILFSFPSPIMRKWTKKEIPQVLFDSYNDLVCKVYDITNPYRNQPFTLKFSKEAYKLFSGTMETYIYSVINDPTVDEETKSLYGKFEGYFGRFCLIKYWIDVASGICKHTGEVSEEQVYTAFQLIKYYLAHAKKTHMLIEVDEEEKKLQKILVKIKDGFKGFATPRELTQAIKWIKTTADAYLWLDKIMDGGYGYKDTDGRRKGVRLFDQSVDHL